MDRGVGGFWVEFEVIRNRCRGLLRGGKGEYEPSVLLIYVFFQHCHSTLESPRILWCLALVERGPHRLQAAMEARAHDFSSCARFLVRTDSTRFDVDVCGVGFRERGGVGERRGTIPKDQDEAVKSYSPGTWCRHIND